MHEMGIANSVLDAVRSEARRFPGRHITKVGVRIGELAGVNPDAMSFCFEALIRGTELEPLSLGIEYLARQLKCLNCGSVFTASVEDSACPGCGATDPLFVSGDELELAYLEVDDGASAAGT
jgi:hydrogenase nickel incorporation protein HypA/HybF